MATPKQGTSKMISRKKLSRARRKRMMERQRLVMKSRVLIERNAQISAIKKELSVNDLINLGEQKNKLELSPLLIELLQNKNNNY